jgi:hypothetical protein
MNYYRLRNSLVRDDVGHYPQATEILYHCPQWYLAGTDSPTLNSTSGSAPVTRVILHSNALLTDLISIPTDYRQQRLLISTRLKIIIESHSTGSIQFEAAEVQSGPAIYPEYWLMTINEDDTDCVDFSNSEVVLRKRTDGQKSQIKRIRVTSLQRFLYFIYLEKPYGELYLNRISVKPGVDGHLLQIQHTENGWDILISETLKNAISHNCTGVNFQPVNYSMRQWLNLPFSYFREP